MKPRLIDSSRAPLLAAICAVAIVPADTLEPLLSASATTWQNSPQTATGSPLPSPQDAATRIPSDQLDSLVAPIAL